MAPPSWDWPTPTRTEPRRRLQRQHHGGHLCGQLPRPAGQPRPRDEGYEETFSKAAPTWGPYLAWGSWPAGLWPVKGDNPPHKISAEGSNLIVVVGTTRDPATVYEWSKQLRDQLANGVLISLDGDGHTAYTRGSQCVDDAIDAYYVRGTVPEDGLTC